MVASTQSVASGSTAESPTTTQHAMALLEAGVPLSLLLDLAGMPHTASSELMTTEVGDTSWVHPRLSA
jgi:hypothetical protein